ncbi:MAG TPA: hypothetical protein PKN36_01905 [bacterium]|nr:hypothetical protein [bacterium]
MFSLSKKRNLALILVSAFILLASGSQAAIDHGMLGVIDNGMGEGVLQLTPGNPATPAASERDWIPCWGVNPWSYDGQWVVYQSRIGTDIYQNSEICIIKADGTNWQRLTNNATCDSHGNFTPDGTKIVFQRYDLSDDEACVWIMDVDGSNQQNLTEAHGGAVTGGCEQKPIVSPDGTRIAFRTCDEDIWVMNIDGSNPVKVTGDLWNCSKHSWSPDSQWILFSADTNDDGYSRVYKVRRDGSGLVMLSEEVGDFCENWAAWSPNGQWISYHRRNEDTIEDTSDLWIMRADGTNKQLLVEGIPNATADGEWTCGPHSWHPGSKWVVFKKWLEGSDFNGLYIINIETRQVTQLTEGYQDGRMWWGPDGRHILFKEHSPSSFSRDGGLYNYDLLVLNLAEMFEVDIEDIISILGGGGNCFIATAAFGSYQEPHVRILRQFRDRYLLTNAAGKAFVRFYYRHSPAAAGVIAKNSVLRTAARIALMPLYGLAYLLLSGFAWIFAALSAAVLLALVLRKKAFAPLFLFLMAAALCFTTPAFALDGNHFSPAIGEELFTMVPTTATLEQGKQVFGFFLSYANDPVRVKIGGVESSLSSHQALGVLGFSSGLTERFQASIKIPFLFAQGSDFTGADEPDSAGLGDIRLEGKYRLTGGGANASGIAFVPYITLDTGSDDAVFSKGSNAIGGILVFDHNWNQKGWFTFHIGFQKQGKEEIGDIKIENTILFGTGLGLKVNSDRTAIALEVFGRADGSSLFDREEETPIEVMVSFKQALKENTMLKLGLGRGVTNGYGTPDYRLFAGMETSF